MHCGRERPRSGRCPAAGLHVGARGRAGPAVAPAGPAPQRRPTVHVRDGELQVRYPDAPGVLTQLRALAAAEQTCCAFATWSVTQVEGHPVLTVRAPAGAPEAVEPIAALFTART